MFDGVMSGLLTVVFLLVLSLIFRKKGSYFIPVGTWPKAIVAVGVAIFTTLIINGFDALFHYQSRISHDMWWTLGDAIALFLGYLIGEAILPPPSKRTARPTPDETPSEPSGFVGDHTETNRYEQPPR